MQMEQDETQTMLQNHKNNPQSSPIIKQGKDANHNYWQSKWPNMRVLKIGNGNKLGCSVYAGVVALVVVVVGVFFVRYFYAGEAVDRGGNRGKVYIKPGVHGASRSHKLDKNYIDPQIINSYNLQYKTQQIGSSPKFQLNLTNFNFTNPFTPFKQTPSQYGIDQRIQVGGNYDLGVGGLVDWDELAKQLARTIPHDVLQFQFDSSLEIQRKVRLQRFRDDQQVEKFLQKVRGTREDRAQYFPQDTEYSLAIRLIKYPQDQQLLQAQYYLADRKYAIGQKQKQLPICVISGHRNLYSKYRYKQYFQTLQLMNYTNFHIVYIDDASTDNSTAEIYKYLALSNSRLKNRIKFVRNYQNLGTLGNLFFLSKLYCGDDDIVIVLDADDAVVGRQAFKVLSSLYENQHVWYVYTDYIINHIQDNFLQRGYQSLYLAFKSYQYRNKFIWITSHMRTFRRKLMDSVPISSYIEYVIDNTTNMASLKFFSLASDLFQVMTHIQLAGNYRVVHIDDFFYHYYGSAGSPKTCYRAQQIYSDALSRLKTPFKPLRKLGDKPERIPKYELSLEDLDKIRMTYQSFQRCKQVLNLKT